MNCEEMVIYKRPFDSRHLRFLGLWKPTCISANKMLGNVGNIPHLGCCVKLHLPLESCLKKTLASNYVDQFFILISIESKKARVCHDKPGSVALIITITSASVVDC
jgi:hypothetical protein